MSSLFYFVAISAAVAYIVVQSVDGTRGGIAAKVTRPTPAISMAIACWVCCSSVRIGRGKTKKKQKNSLAGEHLKRRGICQVDLWCVSFGVAFALFGLGDFLAEARPISSLVVFAAGQAILAAAMLCPREVGDERPPISVRLAVLYGCVAVAAWLVSFFLTTMLAACDAPAAAAALRGAFMLTVMAVAWRSADVAWHMGYIGSLRVLLGAHLFLVSDLFSGLHALCGVFPNPATFYALSMATYYVAVVLEASGVTKHALEADFVISQSDTFQI